MPHWWLRARLPIQLIRKTSCNLLLESMTNKDNESIPFLMQFYHKSVPCFEENISVADDGFERVQISFGGVEKDRGHDPEDKPGEEGDERLKVSVIKELFAARTSCIRLSMAIIKFMEC